MLCEATDWKQTWLVPHFGQRISAAGSLATFRRRQVQWSDPRRAARHLRPPDVMGDDYPSETYRVLNNKELPEFGEYRTLRLVSESWNTLGQGALH